MESNYLLLFCHILAKSKKIFSLMNELYHILKENTVLKFPSYVKNKILKSFCEAKLKYSKLI